MPCTQLTSLVRGRDSWSLSPGQEILPGSLGMVKGTDIPTGQLKGTSTSINSRGTAQWFHQMVTTAPGHGGLIVRGLGARGLPGSSLGPDPKLYRPAFPLPSSVLLGLRAYL